MLDASAWINILGTGFAQQILTALTIPRVAVDVASDEVRRHPLQGNTTDPLAPLIRTGAITRVALNDRSLGLFISLVAADAPDDLGDGEAGTLAFACDSGFAAVLDERKARRIAAERFPNIELLSTVDVLRSSDVADALGDDLADAVFSALANARMRVLAADAAWVIQCVGAQRARGCPTLRRWI